MQSFVIPFHVVASRVALSIVGRKLPGCPTSRMSPYCSAHDEWLIMKLCMYVGYHDANNVLHFGGDPVAQLNFENVSYYYLSSFTDMMLHSRDTVAVYAVVATRSRADCSSMEGHTLPA